MAKESPIPAAKLARYDKLIATQEGVQRKGAKSAYTSRNGHMFSFLEETGRLALRLGPEERKAFLQRHRTELCVQHGHVMKEYVVVPEGLWRKPADLHRAFAASLAYVSGLKPKPTTRKKKATKKAPTSKRAEQTGAKKTRAKKA